MAEIGLILTIVGIAREIVYLAAKAQRNKEKCRQLKEFVETNILLLEELDSQWMPDSVVMVKLLETLRDALKETKALVESCQDARTWSRVFKTQKKADMFDALDQRITRILTQFHISNMILIVKINQERFFMDVLDKLLGHDACSLLPQSEREEMKSLIGSLNEHNMSSDAKRVLKSINKNLARCNVGSTSSAWPGHLGGFGRVETSNGNEPLKEEIIDLADDIARKSVMLRKNRKEIKQLAEFVLQAADMMRRPQSSEMSRDRKTRPMVINLKNDLDQAHNIVLQNDRNRFIRLIIRGISWRQTDEILKVAYKIENHVLVLLPYIMTMR